MRNLSNVIMQEISRQGCTIAEFAEECDVSCRQLNDIKNRKTNDIKFSTLVKICENVENGYADVFEVECTKEFDIEKFVLTNGREKYVLKKI